MFGLFLINLNSALDTSRVTANVTVKSVSDIDDVVAKPTEAASTNEKSEVDEDIAASEEDLPTANKPVDDELVMKCMSDNVDVDSKYKIALFDFGGQTVFNVIHPFFLTQYGVYLVVFNMEWILGTEGTYGVYVVLLFVLCFIALFKYCRRT